MTFDSGMLSLLKQAGPIGWSVLLFLLLLSILSWAVMGIKWRGFRRLKKADTAFAAKFRSCRTLAQAQQAAKQVARCPNSEVFLAGYRELTRQSSSQGSLLDPAERTQQGQSSGIQIAAFERALYRTQKLEMLRLRRWMPVLATAGSVSPFIGLFGTVWGIMRAFQNIGMQANASLAVVAPGIAEALVATAAGLAVAIPAVIGYNFFGARLRDFADEMDSFALELTNLVETVTAPDSGTSR